MLRLFRRPAAPRGSTARTLAGAGPVLALGTALAVAVGTGVPAGAPRFAAELTAAVPVGLTNAGFETGGTNGWGTGGDVSTTTSSAHTGRVSARVVGYTDVRGLFVEGSGVQQGVSGLSGGTRYRLTAWMRTDGRNQKAYLYASKFDGEAQQETSRTAAVPSTWTRYTVVFRTGGSSTSAEVGMSRDRGAGSDYVLFDDVELTRLDDVAPATPASFSATRGDGQVQLTWQAGADTDLAGYDLYRDGVLVTTAAIGGSATSYTDTGLTNDRTYSYALRARDTSDNTSPQAPTQTATPTDLTPPAVPSGLAATPGENQAVLTWAANTEADLGGYDLHRNGARVPGAVLDASATSWTDTGLFGATSYSYKIRSRDAAGNVSDWSAEVTVTPTDTTPPAVPRGVSATAGDSSTTLRWTGGTERDLGAYRVLRDGVVVATLDENSISYRATGLVNGTLYSWTLVAVDRLGNASAPSSPVTSVPRDAVVPAVPSGLTASAGDGLVTLAWTRGTEPDLATYQVLRDGALVATTNHPTTGYTDTGLTNGTTYSYALKAVDTSGNTTAASSAVTAVPRDLTAPSAPTGLTATRGSGGVDLAWSSGAESDLAVFTVYRDGVAVGTVTAPATSYRDATADPGTTYAYRVSASDRAGNESSRSGSATVLDAVGPLAPGAPTATSADQAVTLTWTASTSSDLQGYRVVRDGVVVATLSAGALSFTDTGRTNGVQHTYEVRAFDAVGNATASAQVTGTAKDGVAPGSPTDVTAVPGNASATISWTRPSDGDLAAYRVHSSDGTLLATVTHPATSAVVGGLTNGTALQVYVVAVDTSTNPSAASTTVSVTPVAPVATAPAGAGATGAFAMSRDGRWLVTATTAALEPTDTNDYSELYRIDTTGVVAARRIKPLSAFASSPDTTNSTSSVAISDDGRYVALVSDERLDRPAPHPSGGLNAYRADLSGTTTTWVQVSTASGASGTAGVLRQTGDDGSAPSLAVAMSADGQRVAFYSDNGSLTGGGTGVVVKDLASGAVAVASTGSGGGNLGGRTAQGPALAMSADGRYVLFTAGGVGARVVVRKDLGTTSGSAPSSAGAALVASTAAPVAPGGLQPEVAANRDAGDVAVSDDGRYVVFSTTAKLATDRTQSTSFPMAFWKDLVDGTVVALGDGQTGQQEHRVSLSSDGSRAAFTVGTAVKVRQIANGAQGALTTVVAGSGGSGLGLPAPALTTDGRVGVVTTLALSTDDVNGLRDAYAVHLGSGSAAALIRR